MRSFTVLPLLLITAPAWCQLECHPVDAENFSSGTGWTHEGVQTDVGISGGAMVWNGAACGVYDRWWRPLEWGLVDECFTATFTLTVVPNPNGQGVGANLFAVSAGTLDALSYDASQSYEETDQDGLVVVLTSAGDSDNDIDNWVVMVQEKDGADRYYPDPSEWIYLDASISTYYVRLRRISYTQTVLDLYVDADLTNLHGTSDFAIHSTVGGLNTLQAGVNTFGNFIRHFSGTVDDIDICSCAYTAGVQEPIAADLVPLIQQDGNGVTIALATSEAYRVTVMDAAGRLVTDDATVGSAGMRSVLAPGLYIARLSSGDRHGTARFVVR